MFRIPKIIHYCWLSEDPLPAEILKYIESWRNILPDYEIKRWSYKNFPRGKSKWVDEAFDAKKYAFAADYIRCYALFHEGGIYLDSDVEILKSFNPLMHLPYFIGQESDGIWEAAVVGGESGMKLFGEMIRYYDTHRFKTPDGFDTTPMPRILKAIGEKLYRIKYIDSAEAFNRFNSDLQILPSDYFSPKSYKTGEIRVTNRTFAIHHFTASWHGRKEKVYRLFVKVFGEKMARTVSNLYKSLKSVCRGYKVRPE